MKGKERVNDDRSTILFVKKIDFAVNLKRTLTMNHQNYNTKV